MLGHFKRIVGTIFSCNVASKEARISELSLFCLKNTNMQGWIKLHRKIIESIAFENEKCLKVWIWCLAKASHKQSSFLFGRQKITIKKGQFIMGGIKAEETLKIARSTIYYWLSFLESEGQVDIKKTNKYTIITIKNWEKYQVLDIKSTSNVTTDEHQIDTYKNNREWNKNNKEKGIILKSNNFDGILEECNKPKKLKI